MPAFRLIFVAASALFVACKSESSAPKPPSTFAAFPNLPLPPSSKFVSRAGSEDALQIRLFSAGQPDEITEYYRNTLSGGRWQLISDMKNPDGTVVLYAEHDGRPLWVRIWPTSDKQGTMVELSGAVVAKKTDSSQMKRSDKPRRGS